LEGWYWYSKGSLSFKGGKESIEDISVISFGGGSCGRLWQC